MNTYVLRLIIVSILASIMCDFSTGNAKINVNIKQETQNHKKALKKQLNISSVCFQLEKYQNYVDEALSEINKKFAENKQLYKKIEQYGKFEKNKVILIKNKDKEIDAYSQYLKENGLKIGYSEGDIYLYFDPNYIATSFKDVLPDYMIEYYSIEADDVKEGFESDLVLTIPWDSLRKRLVRYETYLNKINKVNCSYLKTLTKDKISLYANVYMLGLANSSIEDKILDAKNSYEIFLKENKPSRYYGMIEKYYADLKRNDFRFLRKEEIKGDRKYAGPTILDKSGNQVYIDELAKKYLRQYGLTIVDLQ